MAEIYKPSYVDYWKKSGSKFNLDDYTRLVGSRLFPANIIYRPLTVAVSMNPDVAYNLQVDTARQDWNEVLCAGVKKMMGVAAHLEVSLKDDRGRDISSFPLKELMRVGLVYPHLENGRFASNKVNVDTEVPTLLSTNKRALFKNWMEKVSESVTNLVSSSLAQCADVTEIGDRLTLKSTKSIKKQISEAIGAEFEKQVEIQSADSDVKLPELAEKVANLIMAALVEGFKHNKDRVSDYKQFDKQQKKQQQTVRISSDVATQGERNIFESEVVNKAGASLHDEYPTQKHLFADIIQTSMEKENIGNHVYYLMTHRPVARRLHHHHHKKGKKAHRRRHHRHPGRNYPMNDKTRRLVLARHHQMSGLPPFRRTITISCNGVPSTRTVNPAVKEMRSEGPPSLYSAEAPSLEATGGDNDTRSMPSIEPMPRTMMRRGDDEDVPELETTPSRPRQMRMKGQADDDVPELETAPPRSRQEEKEMEVPDAEPIWTEEEEGDAPPALESYLGSDEDPTPAPVTSAIKSSTPKSSTPKYRGTEPTIVVDVGTKAPEIVSSGLPSLTEMKKALGLHVDATIASSLLGEFSASIDGPVYGKSVDVASHYIGLRCRSRGHHHHKKGRGRRVFLLNRSMTPVMAQEIQGFDTLSDVEESIAPYVSSSYESGADGTVAFVTADGKDHKIRPDGVHFVDGRRLPLRVEKLVEQEIRGEPMLLVLERNN